YPSKSRAFAAFGRGRSHRRDKPVLADKEKAGLDRAVLLLGPAGDDRRAGLEIRLRAGLEADDRRLRVDDDGLLAAFVSDGKLGAGRRIDAGGDVAVRHRAFRPEIEGAEALARPAHRLGKDVHFHGLELVPVAWQCGAANKGPWLPLGK